jgi:CubicO group peptidase (beta-lactamase class C family)
LKVHEPQARCVPREDLLLMLRYLVEDRETPGIVIGLLEADGSTRIVSYGNAGANAQPLGAKSVFEMGSITKTFTGTLLADMVERGEVSLSDPVGKYLPANAKVPSRNGRQITLLDLATHRSALPRMPDNISREPGNPYPRYTIESMYAFLSAHPTGRHDVRRYTQAGS